jgi:hypothetical protein
MGPATSSDLAGSQCVFLSQKVLLQVQQLDRVARMALGLSQSGWMGLIFMHTRHKQLRFSSLPGHPI